MNIIDVILAVSIAAVLAALTIASGARVKNTLENKARSYYSCIEREATHIDGNIGCRW